MRGKVGLKSVRLLFRGGIALTPDGSEASAGTVPRVGLESHAWRIDVLSKVEGIAGKKFKTRACWREKCCVLGMAFQEILSKPTHRREVRARLSLPRLACSCFSNHADRSVNLPPVVRPSVLVTD